MKTKFTLFLVLSIAFAVESLPQEKKFFDAPFGGGGGYTPAWYFVNTDIVNEQLNQIGLPEIASDGLFSSGGGGFIYIGFVPFLRVGGMGYGGSSSVTAVINGENKEVLFNIGGGGLTLEYTLPFLRDVAVSIGGIIGGGSLSIDTYSNNNSGSYQGFWNDFKNGSTDNTSSSLHTSFWFVAPTINIDIPLYRFVSFRIGGGYQVTLAEDWKIDNDIDISGPGDLNGNGLFIQSGIFIGFFSY